MVFKFRITLPRRMKGTSTDSCYTTADWSVKAAANVSSPTFLLLSAFVVYIRSLLVAQKGNNVYNLSLSGRLATNPAVQIRGLIRRVLYYRPGLFFWWNMPLKSHLTITFSLFRRVLPKRLPRSSTSVCGKHTPFRNIHPWKQS